MTDRYKVILADPPWNYAKRQRKRRMMRWLKWKLAQLGMEGYATKKKQA